MTRRDNDPLLKLAEYGQSYWLDDLRRRMIESGELQRRVSERGLRGVTSNPGIFHKAIADSKDYERQIEEAVAAGFTAQQLYEALVVTDVRNACDILRSVYDKTNGIDGYVSLEVSPHLAHDNDGSVEEARRLHNAVDRPNLFIKIPGTQCDRGMPSSRHQRQYHAAVFYRALRRSRTLIHPGTRTPPGRRQTGRWRRVGCQFLSQSHRCARRRTAAPPHQDKGRAPGGKAARQGRSS